MMRMKPLLLFIIFSLVILAPLTPAVNAGVWEDLTSWFSDVFGGESVFAIYGMECLGSIFRVSITENEIVYNIVKNPIDVCRYQNPGSVGLCLNVVDVHSFADIYARALKRVSKEQCNQYAEWWPGMRTDWTESGSLSTGYIDWCMIYSLPTKTDDIEIIDDITVSGTIDPMYQGREGSCTPSKPSVIGMTELAFKTSKLDCIRSTDNKDVSGSLAILYSVSGIVILSKTTIEPPVPYEDYGYSCEDYGYYSYQQTGPGEWISVDGLTCWTTAPPPLPPGECADPMRMCGWPCPPCPEDAMAAFFNTILNFLVQSWENLLISLGLA